MHGAWKGSRGETSEEDAETARGAGKVGGASQRVQGTRIARVTRANACGC